MFGIEFSTSPSAHSFVLFVGRIGPCFKKFSVAVITPDILWGP